MVKLGDARVSTHQQDLSLQLASLKEAGVQDYPDLLFTDKASGKNDKREGLQLLLTKARKDDHIIIAKELGFGRQKLYDILAESP